MTKLPILTQSPWILGTLLGAFAAQTFSVTDESVALSAGLRGYLALMCLGLAPGFAGNAGVSSPLYTLAAGSVVCVIAVGLVTMESYFRVTLGSGISDRPAILPASSLLLLLTFA